jgi:Arc/MetJ-type ribon-helix-helix transcriptional regulator
MNQFADRKIESGHYANASEVHSGRIKDGLIIALTRDKRLSTLVPLFTRGMRLKIGRLNTKSKKGIYLK